MEDGSNTAELEEVFTVAELAKARKVSDQYLYNEIAAWERGDPNGLQATRYGRAVRITRAALTAWDKAHAGKKGVGR